MLANPTVEIRYAHRHHWRWLVRRMGFPALRLVTWMALALLLASSRAARAGTLPGILWVLPCGLVLLEVLRLAWLYLDWRRRTIRLFSDGHLEYEYGILRRSGISIMTRFGTLRYRIRSLFCRMLDCADIVLPFDGGIIQDIPEFRSFWEIAQGRR